MKAYPSVRVMALSVMKYSTSLRSSGSMAYTHLTNNEKLWSLVRPELVSVVLVVMV